jgi:hypothetical protein
MSRKPDSIATDLPFTARHRVILSGVEGRLTDTLASSRIFHGWGPGLER